jgi:hypothetical protein
MVDYDPETSYGKIVRYRKDDPDQYETVGGLIQGREAILKRLRELKSSETDRETWGYYWKWVKRDGASISAGGKQRKKSKAEEADADW